MCSQYTKLINYRLSDQQRKGEYIFNKNMSKARRRSKSTAVYSGDRQNIKNQGNGPDIYKL